LALTESTDSSFKLELVDPVFSQKSEMNNASSVDPPSNLEARKNPSYQGNQEGDKADNEGKNLNVKPDVPAPDDNSRRPSKSGGLDIMESQNQPKV
jgi:hypothetical protein